MGMFRPAARLASVPAGSVVSRLHRDPALRVLAAVTLLGCVLFFVLDGDQRGATAAQRLTPRGEIATTWAGRAEHNFAPGRWRNW